MRSIGEAGYVLTLRELVFLAAMTGAEEMYGINDDTYLMEEKELEREWEKVKLQLETKKYVEVELDGTITVDKDLYALAQTCSHPEVFIRYTVRNNESRIHSRNCYVTRKIAVELDEDRFVKDKYILTPLTSIEKIADGFKECCEFAYTYRCSDINFSVPIPQFERLNGLIEKAEKPQAISLLDELGCKAMYSEDLYDALSEKKLHMSIIILRTGKGEAKDMASCYISEGREHLWKIDMNHIEGISDITIKSSSPELAAKEVENLVMLLKGIYE